MPPPGSGVSAEALLAELQDAPDGAARERVLRTLYASAETSGTMRRALCKEEAVKLLSQQLTQVECTESAARLLHVLAMPNSLSRVSGLKASREMVVPLLLSVVTAGKPASVCSPSPATPLGLRQTF